MCLSGPGDPDATDRRPGGPSARYPLLITDLPRFRGPEGDFSSFARVLRLPLPPPDQNLTCGGLANGSPDAPEFIDSKSSEVGRFVMKGNDQCWSLQEPEGPIRPATANSVATGQRYRRSFAKRRELGLEGRRPAGMGPPMPWQRAGSRIWAAIRSNTDDAKGLLAFGNIALVGLGVGQRGNCSTTNKPPTTRQSC